MEPRSLLGLRVTTSAASVRQRLSTPTAPCQYGVQSSSEAPHPVIALRDAKPLALGPLATAPLLDVNIKGASQSMESSGRQASTAMLAGSPAHPARVRLAHCTGRHLELSAKLLDAHWEMFWLRL